MNTVYHLKNDSESIMSLQRGSLSEGPIGLRITHGLIGSEEWWRQIESGALPLLTVSGVVSGFWPGQGGLGPAEFELRQPNGAPSRWFCELDPEPAKQLFSIGSSVKVEYVVQERKTEFEGRRDSKITVSISLGPA